MSGSGTGCPAAVVYHGTVVHSRKAGAVHQFRRKVWMPLIDLDRVDELANLWPLWSSRFPAIIRYRRDDYGGDRRRAANEAQPLADEIRDLVELRTGARLTGRVELLAQVRTWGWLFNPLSVYYCYEPAGLAPAAAVLEVTNTPWGERTHYVLDLRTPETTTVRVAKKLHVSPFLPMDLDYDIRVPAPGARCTVAITVRQDGAAVFSAAMSLGRRPLTRLTLIGALIRHPLLTHRVSSGIYTHALQLWLKGVAYVPHPVPSERSAPKSGRATTET